MPPINVSHIRRRDIVLGKLIPKILGIVWETGGMGNLGPKAVYDHDLEISAYRFRPGGISVSVWTPDAKVLSLHLASDPFAVDPEFFRYQSGRCRVTNWRRGVWEDRIMTSTARPRPIWAAFAVGIALSDESL